LPDVFLYQIQRLRRVANNLITFTAFVALFAEIVLVKGISAGTMRRYEQGTVCQGGLIKISGIFFLFQGVVQCMLLINMQRLGGD
jgi:hypothetical protein